MRPREHLQTSESAANREIRVSGQVRSAMVIEAGENRAAQHIVWS